MESFIKKNELGINCEYHIIANIKQKEEYIIYTDFLTDNNQELKLYVGKIHNNKIEEVDSNLKKEILNEFKLTERIFLDNEKEQLYE